MPRSETDRTRLLVVLWAIVILELVSPVPLVLTLGAAYVLLVRPAWFPRIVRELYADVPSGAAD